MGWVEGMERNWKLKNELQGCFRIIEIYETRIKTRLSFLYTVQTQELKGSGWRCGFILTSGQKQTKSWREGGKLKIRKGIEFLPQTQFFWSQYLCNLIVQTFDISNLDYFIYININSLKYLRSTTLGYKDIEIRKSEFGAKTQLLYKMFSCFS